MEAEVKLLQRRWKGKPRGFELTTQLVLLATELFVAHQALQELGVP
jgi:hypothetical protein